jgi:hypothetical protein
MTYWWLFPKAFSYLGVTNPEITLCPPDYKYTIRLLGSRSFCIHPRAGNSGLHGRAFAWTKGPRIAVSRSSIMAAS